MTPEPINKSEMLKWLNELMFTQRLNVRKGGSKQGRLEREGDGVGLWIGSRMRSRRLEGSNAWLS